MATVYILRLPAELLVCIFDHVVPYGWNGLSLGKIRRTLRARQVCMLFDDYISNQAIKKLDHAKLDSSAPTVSLATVYWLFRAKAMAGGGSSLDLIRDVRAAVEPLVLWRKINDQTVDPRTCLSDVCQTILAQRGKTWVCEQLGHRRAYYTCEPPLSPPTPTPTATATATATPTPTPTATARLYGWNVEEEELSSRHVPAGSRAELKKRILLEMHRAHCLQVASFSGDLELANAILQLDEGDANDQHVALGCALYAAVWSGEIDIARQLLACGADVDGSCEVEFRGYRGTPLEVATSESNLTVMTLLLGTGAKPGLSLFHAVRNGDVEGVRLLLAQPGIDVNVEKDGQTPVLAAAQLQEEEVVELLVAHRDFKPNTVFEGTVLWWATCHGWEGVVQHLLAREDTDINLPSTTGETPIAAAARLSRDQIAYSLLGQSRLDPNLASGHSTTPLLLAVEQDNLLIVNALLARRGVSPNGPRNTWSPLHEAAAEDRKGCLERLLQHQDLDLNARDDSLQTALIVAIGFRRHEVVRLLLAEKKHLDPNQVDGHGLTPLHWAATMRELSIVRALRTQRSDVDPNVNNGDGTPLWCAANRGYASIVRELLRWEKIEPNLPRMHGTPRYLRAVRKPVSGGGAPTAAYEFKGELTGTRDGGLWAGTVTPLGTAATRGAHEVVRLLLRHPRTGPNFTDRARRTPLWWATFGGHTQCVRHLLRHQETDPNLADDAGWSPLMVAVCQGHVAIAELLLREAAIDRRRANRDGISALDLARSNNQSVLVELLADSA